MPERVLVTGASGFVGSVLADELLDAGCAVRCLLRETSSRRWLQTDRVEPVVAGLSDSDALARAMEDVSVVYHAAGAVKAPDEAAYRRVNVEGSRMLAQAAKGAGVKRFIYVSSLAAVGPSPKGAPHDEESEPRPSSAYGRSKLQGETAAREAFGAGVTVIRPPAVYGPRDVDFPKLFRLVKSGLAPRVAGPAQDVSVVHAFDLARGMRLAAESDNTVGETYFLAEGTLAGWSELGRAAAGALGVKYREVVIPRSMLGVLSRVIGAACALAARPNPFPPDRVRDLTAPSWACSPEKARRDFAYETRFPWEEAIPDTVAWCREQGWV